MRKESVKSKTPYYVMIPIIVLTLGFIFYASTMSKSESLNMSNGFSSVFGEFVGKILSFFTDKSIDIRKVAHFAEYAALGFETALLAVLVSKKNLQTLCNIALFGLASAVTDESIQILSHRGPAVSDVLLDFFGYSAGVLTVIAAYFIIILIKRIKSKRTNN